MIQLDDFSYFRNACFHHYAHKADIVRLLAINLVGGVYLDIDTITQKPFENLRRHSFTMGVQAGGSVAASGLCNAVLIGQPGATFLEALARRLRRVPFERPRRPLGLPLGEAAGHHDGAVA